ncbi:beta-propeller fold lactonase family protein [Streptomyces sp. NPDC051658]|uniref:beta-propeller fold lactonase family protein n=1 Tax=Streptomyces sp. NPDC051658 TaxID=3365667 RepID=UPI0037BCD9C2
MLAGLTLQAIAPPLAWASPGPNAYVANGVSNNVSVIDTTTNTVVGSPIPVGNNPAGVAITPNGQRAYVTNGGSNNVSVIDTATNTVVGSPIPVGNNPLDVAITPNGQRAYITNEQSNSVSVIDTTTNTVVGSPIPVGNNPFGIAIAPASQKKPSLTIAKSRTGEFTRGDRGTYTITVGNTGPAPTDGTTVTVRDTLPRGLTADRISGSGWNCTRSTLTCTRRDVLPAGSSYPPITLTVRVSCSAPARVTNKATVTGGGDTTTHTATAPTTTKPDKHCGKHDHR